MRHRPRAVLTAGLVVAALAAGCTADTEPEGGTAGTSTGPPSVSSGGQTTPTAATEPTEPGEPTQAPFEAREVTALMNGDILLHEGLWSTAEIDAARTGRGAMDFRPLLGEMKPVVSEADLAICHMETPLAPAGGPYLGYPVFSVPPAIVPALKWTGYDVCTTASNHSIDQGFDGLTRTLEDFAAADIPTVGTAATRRASRRPLVVDVDGVSVGLVSATYGTNGIPLPSEQPWSVQLIDTDAILRLVARAKAQRADVVMVALHWGLEYTHAPVQAQLDVAEALTKSPDIDLVYGHHAHVVQPYDKVGGTWVVYGLGNAVAQQDTAVEGVYDGNTARVTFRERRDGSFRVARLEYIPTMITTFDGTNPMRLLNVPQALDDPDYVALRPQLLATRDRVRAIVNLLGAFKRGVVEGH